MKFSFTLDRSLTSSSIFCGVPAFERVDPDMINGFIHNKMGIKFHKSGKFKNMPYKNEQELFHKYKGKMSDDGKVSVEYQMASHKWGRVQPVGSLSLSLFHRPTRHSLCTEKYVDFDMVNCQPSVVNQVCLQNGISNTQCIAYCADPKTWRHNVAKHHNLKPIYYKETQTTLSAYEQAKKLFISLSFGGSYAAWKTTYHAENQDLGEIIEMETELSHVMDRIWKDNQDMVKTVTEAKPNWKSKHTNEKKRSIMGLWAQTLEKILQETCILSLCNNVGFDMSAIVPCQDGFMILKSELERCRSIFQDNINITSGMETELQTIFGFDIKWEIKPFDEPLPSGIPRVKSADVDAPLLCEKSFAFMCKEFEKTHCKIHDTAMFICSHPDGDIVMTQSHLTTAYSHLHYNEVVKGELKKLSFIHAWLKYPEMSIKRCVSIIPPDLKCPDDVYNAWRPFSMETVNIWTNKSDDLLFMRNHLKILCNHDVYCADYFEKWIACAIQFPSIKLPMPVFVSGEGAGKGSIVRLLSAMLGSKKILQSQEPSKEVWGEFNSLMLNSYMVILDEISKKEMSGCEGKFKGLITEPTIRINDKGKSRFEVPSYHKFIAMSNPDAYGNEPMTTTKDDRRKFFIQSSDELIGNSTYFDKFASILDSQDSVKYVFDYFKTLPDAKTVFKMKLPVSEYNLQLKEMATPPLLLFITDFIRTNSSYHDVSSAELFKSFQDWKDRSGYRYDCNALQFSCRMSNLKIRGMEKKNNMGVHRGKGWELDRTVIREALGLGLLAPLVSDGDTDVD